jgi:hypothetical protein
MNYADFKMPKNSTMIKPQTFHKTIEKDLTTFSTTASRTRDSFLFFFNLFFFCNNYKVNDSSPYLNQGERNTLDKELQQKYDVTHIRINHLPVTSRTIKTERFIFSHFNHLLLDYLINWIENFTILNWLHPTYQEKELF